jgi:cell division protein FtsQ
MSIDPRLMERRKTVAEDNAKRNVTRLLKFIAVLVVVGGIVWVAFSPWLSVSQVTTTGVVASDTHSLIVENGVTAGTPMIRLSASDVERALLDDPWVAEATVGLHWPDVVSVEVVERTPVAWVEDGQGWARRAVDGVALPSPDTPDDDMARIQMPHLSGEAGTTASADLLAALEFVEALPARLRAGTVLTTDQDEIWASVMSYQVRLGRGVDMTQKALVLDALIRKGIPEGSTVVLIAATNPSTSIDDSADPEDES